MLCCCWLIPRQVEYQQIEDITGSQLWGLLFKLFPFWMTGATLSPYMFWIIALFLSVVRQQHNFIPNAASVKQWSSGYGCKVLTLICEKRRTLSGSPIVNPINDWYNHF